MPELTRPLKEFLEEYETIDQLTNLAVQIELLLQNLLPFSEMVLKLVKLIKHCHKCHRHVSDVQDTSSMDASGDGFSIAKINPKIEFISLELYSKQDLTQNSIIYGTDYFFDNFSKSTPPGYRVINKALKTKSSGIPQISWDKYRSYVMSSILKCSSTFSLSGSYDKEEIETIKETIIQNSDISNIAKNFILEIKYAVDLDNNNLIYGKDFIIPEVNKSNEYLQIVTASDDIKQISLNDYLKSINIITEEIIMLSVPYILEPELINILIQEIQTGIDVDGDGYIYGKDILILDPPSILSQHIPPFIPATIISWNSFKQYYSIFLETINRIRTIEYYVQLLIEECNSHIDTDFNGLIYNIDFIIKNDKYRPEDLYCDNENQSLYQISFKEYIETLPFEILKNSGDSGSMCVRLAHEFSNKLDLIDTDNNGCINGIDFITNDYDPNKFSSLIELEKNSMFSIKRDNLKYIKCRYFSNIETIPEYTQLEFNNYWTSINGIQDDLLFDVLQDNIGRTIENNQVVSVCCPMWVNKTGLLPLFIPVLSLYDIEAMSSSQETKTLTVSKIGEGYIDSIPKIIGCGIICDCQVPYNSRITLFAYPSYGYEFTSWSGYDECDSILDSNEEDCKLIMFNDKTITCTFSLKNYILKINKVNGDGTIKDRTNTIICNTGCGIDSPGEYTILHGTKIDLEVISDSGYDFIGWDGVDEYSDYTASLTIFTDRIVTANFVKTYTLSINVLTDPDIVIDVYYLNIKQPTASSYTFKENSEIVLYISPSNAYKLDNFDGVDTSFGNRCTVNMTSNRIVTIHLSLKTFYLTILKLGGSGTVSDLSGIINCGSICTAVVQYGQTITLNVFPDSGYEFVNWNGSDNDSNSLTCSVNMITNKTITANFRSI